jgi:NagD protein
LPDRLKNIAHVALDLDGTLYLGGKLFPSTLRFLQVIRELRVGRTFFTNNSSKSTEEYLHRLQRLGIDVQPSEVYSSTLCTLDYLREERPNVRRIFVLGTPALQQEFAQAGYQLCTHDDPGASEPEPDAVIVGFDTTLAYPRLCRAAWWLSRGKPFIATHCDAVCPTDLPTVLPDCGAICRLLSHATGREPDAVLGKPHPRMLGGVMRRHSVRADQLAVVGDRLYTDIAMARSAGALGILVLSGETTREEARLAKPQPDLVVEDVGRLADLFLERFKK